MQANSTTSHHNDVAQQQDTLSCRGLDTASLIERLHTQHTPLKTLVIEDSDLDAQAMRELVNTPHMRGLESITLRNCALDDAAVSALCEWPQHFDRLTQLDLSQNDIGDEGVIALVQARAMRCLSHLVLDSNDLSDRSVMAIAMTHHLSQLIHLSVRDHQDITDASVKWLVQRAQIHFPQLNDVILTGCGVGLETRRQLSKAMQC